MDSRPSFGSVRFAAAISLLLVALLFSALPQANADTVVLNSGSAVTYLDSGKTSGDFSAPFTSSSFTAAQNGKSASPLSSILTQYYTKSLTGAPGAEWIGTNSSAGINSGDTALFAISFDIAGSVSSASLDLAYAVDNALGASNAGIYINGHALPNSISCYLCGTNYSQTNYYLDSNIAQYLVTGKNTLYIDAVNGGGQEGLLFSATINYVDPPIATPEASTAVLLALAVVGLLALSLRNKTFAALVAC
jgi:hypothetical protein